MARRAYASAPKRKKKVQVDGRSLDLCRKVVEMCSATCWLSAEQTSLIGGAFAVPMLSGLCDTAGGELVRPKAETRIVLRRAVSSARRWKVTSLWYVHGDQQERPLPSHFCCGRRCRRKGAPSIEKPPVKEQGLWARWKAKAKSFMKKTIGEIGGTLPQQQVKLKTTQCVRISGGDTECTLQVCQLSRSSAGTHFFAFVET